MTNAAANNNNNSNNGSASRTTPKIPFMPFRDEEKYVSIVKHFLELNDKMSIMKVSPIIFACALIAFFLSLFRGLKCLWVAGVVMLTTWGKIEGRNQSIGQKLIHRSMPPSVNSFHFLSPETTFPPSMLLLLLFMFKEAWKWPIKQIVTSKINSLRFMILSYLSMIVS